MDELLIDPLGRGAVRRATVDHDDFVAPDLLGCDATAIGVTDEVMLTGDGAAYPIVEGIPVLMPPERLLPSRVGIQIAGTHYEEAYQEQRLYTELAEQELGASARGLAEVRRVVESAEPHDFPNPPAAWFGAGSTAGAYGRAMQHLGPVSGRVALQIGGVGTHALKLLHAGARHAVVVSPVIAELIEGRTIARECGLSDRVTFVAGVAEELPIADGSIDIVYSGSSIHHTETTRSFPAIRRVLATGGRWAAVDVWKSWLHGIGTTAFGKCNGNRFCRPMSTERLAPAFDAFPDATASFHGGTVRYPLALMERLGRRPGPELGVRMARLEDAIPLGPLTEGLSSLICVTGSTAEQATPPVKGEPTDQGRRSNGRPA